MEEVVIGLFAAAVVEGRSAVRQALISISTTPSYA